MMARWTRIVGALGLILAFAVVADAPKASAASTLSLSPNHGPPGTSVTLTYTHEAVECFADPVTFKWGSAHGTWASATLNPATCTAVAVAAAKSGTPGPITIRAYLFGVVKASKTFTLEAAPATTTTTSPPLIVTPTTSGGGPFPTSAISATTTAGSSTTSSTSSTTTSTTATDDTTATDGAVAVGPNDSDQTDIASAGATDGGGGGSSSGGHARSKDVSVFVAATPGPQQSTLALSVVATNVILTMLLLLVFGGTSAVFNSTLNSNRDVIEGWTSRLRARVRGVGRWLKFGATMSPRARVLLIVVLSGTVYGFLSPDFSFDRAGLLLFLSLAIGITAVTYVSEGGAIWFARHRLKAAAAIRVHTGALFTALACVLISRSLGFQPGLMYGFVASAALLGTKLDRRQTGRAAFYPALILLVTSVLAWVILGLVRSGESDGWFIQLVEAMLAVLFVGGIEGVLYKMLPIAFLEGRAIIEWNRMAWLGLFGVSTFLFWQLLINPHDSYIDAVRETGVALVLSAALLYALVTMGTWYYFRRLATRAEAAKA